MARKPRSRSAVKGSSNVILPSGSLVGKIRSARPGGDLGKGEAIQNNLNQYIATAINAVRTRSDINEIIRTLMREDGLFSSAANSMVAIATKSGYRLAAYNSAGVMDSGVMTAAYSIIDKIDTLHDYSQGYNDKQGIQALLSTLQIDTIGSGGCGVELVLDAAFGPERLVPIGYSTITWEANGKGGRYPTQDGGGHCSQLP